MNEAHPELATGGRGSLIQSAQWMTVVGRRLWSVGLRVPGFDTKLSGVIKTELTGSLYQSGETFSSSFLVHPCPRIIILLIHNIPQPEVLNSPYLELRAAGRMNRFQRSPSRSYSGFICVPS